MIPYCRTTPFTNASSALLAILHHHNQKISLSKKNEFLIWRETVILPTRASSIYGLAVYAKKQGLEPEVVVEEKGYDFPDYRFYRYKKRDIEYAQFSSGLHLKEAEKMGISIEVKDINLQDIKKELKKDRIIILRINTKPIRNQKRNTSNYIVVHGYDERKFRIIDPSQGGLSIPEEVFKEAFTTLETKKHRTHRMVVFQRPAVSPP